MKPRTLFNFADNQNFCVAVCVLSTLIDNENYYLIAFALQRIAFVHRGYHRQRRDEGGIGTPVKASIYTLFSLPVVRFLLALSFCKYCFRKMDAVSISCK